MSGLVHCLSKPSLPARGHAPCSFASVAIHARSLPALAINASVEHSCPQALWLHAELVATILALGLVGSLALWLEAWPPPLDIIAGSLHGLRNCTSINLRNSCSSDYVVPNDFIIALRLGDQPLPCCVQGLEAMCTQDGTPSTCLDSCSLEGGTLQSVAHRRQIRADFTTTAASALQSPMHAGDHYTL